MAVPLAEQQITIITAAVLRSAAGCVTALIGLLVLITGNSFEVSVGIALLSLITQAPLVFEKYLQINHLVTRLALARLCAFLVSSGARLALIFSSAPVEAFAAIVAIEPILNTIFLLGAPTSSLWTNIRTNFKFKEAANLLQSSWPFITSGLLVASYFRLEQLLVLWIAGPEHFGVYAVATRLATFATTLFPVFLGSILPVILDRGQSESGKTTNGSLYVSHDFNRLLSLATSLGLILSLATATFTLPIIQIIFGNKYSGAIPLAILLSLTAPAIMSGAVRAQFFLLHDCGYLHNVAASVGIIINGILTIVLVPRIGLLGAVFGSIFGAYSSSIGTSLVFRKTRAFGRAQVLAFGTMLSASNLKDFHRLTIRVKNFIKPWKKNSR